MKAKLNKDQFTAKVNSRLELRKELERVYKEVVLTTIEKFNGKVINERFNKAIREQFSNVYDIRLISCNSYNATKREYELTIRRKGNYSDSETIYFAVSINNECRIQGLDNERNFYASFLNTNEELKQSIKDYNKSLKLAEKLQKIVSEYASLPCELRENFEYLKDRHYLSNL